MKRYLAMNVRNFNGNKYIYKRILLALLILFTSNHGTYSHRLQYISSKMYFIHGSETRSHSQSIKKLQFFRRSNRALWRTQSRIHKHVMPGWIVFVRSEFALTFFDIIASTDDDDGPLNLNFDVLIRRTIKINFKLILHVLRSVSMQFFFLLSFTWNLEQCKLLQSSTKHFIEVNVAFLSVFTISMLLCAIVRNKAIVEQIHCVQLCWRNGTQTRKGKKNTHTHNSMNSILLISAPWLGGCEQNVRQRVSDETNPIHSQYNSPVFRRGNKWAKARWKYTAFEKRKSRRRYLMKQPNSA